MKPLPLRVYQAATDSGASERQIAFRVIIFVGLCMILYFGRDILIPVVLAILLSILLTPLVRGIQRLGLPKAAGVLVAVALTILTLAGTTVLVGTTLTNLASDLPAYENNLREKARSLKAAAAGSGALDKAAGVLEDLQVELEKRAPGDLTPPEASVKPIPVEVYDTQLGPLDPLVKVVAVIAHPLAQIGIVILILTFILFNREDLRNRLVRLAGTGDIHRTTVALDEAGSRLSRLFIGQLAINFSTGAFLGTVFFFLGIPGAVLWGLLTAILRFVPFVGTMLSSILPIVIALAVGDGWLLPIFVALIIIAAEVAAGNILEPIFLGRMTGVSATAIVVAAAFWATLWGPVGLILATPITVGLMVIGRHIESLRFLEVLFGTEPVLSPDLAFYHHMLAGDAIEASESALAFQDEENLGAYLETVAVPGLLLAHHDERRGVLSKDKSILLATTFSETLEETWAETPHVEDSDSVILVANHGVLNFAATVAVSALLRLKRIPHRMLPQDAITPGKFPDLSEETVRCVCLCSLVASSGAQLAYMARRIEAQTSDVRIIHVAWEGTSNRSDVLSPSSAAALLPVISSDDTASAPLAAQ